jgi:hypothetical protein
MASWYKTNFVKTPIGNGIKEKQTLHIDIAKAAHISGAIYKNNLPVIAFFSHGGHATVKIQRKGRSLKGLCVLKVRGSDKGNKSFGIDDAFVVL